MLTIVAVTVDDDLLERHDGFPGLKRVPCLACLALPKRAKDGESSDATGHVEVQINSLFPMVPWALLLSSLPLSVAAGQANVLGVAPSQQSLYAPSKSGTWKCLDGQKEIPWSFVNDDSCDCADGSDEPGLL